MSAIAELLDQARKGGNFSSDMGLAARLGVTRQTLHAWRKGTAPMPDERIAQACSIGKLDGAAWMAKIHAEKAQSREERALWKSMLDRLSAAAAVVALVCVSVPGVANAKSININDLHASTAHILYIMFKVARRGLARILPLTPSPQLRRNLANA